MPNWQGIHGKNPFYYLSLGSVENSALMLPAFSELFDFFDFAQPYLETEYSQNLFCSDEVC